MKKRVLFSACALAACFAACTNDDFQAEKNNANNVVNEAGEVVGADLVSAGMTITSFGDKSPVTRVATDENGNAYWEAGKDATGVAWFQYKDGDASTPGIKQKQEIGEWYNKTADQMSTDCSIYANHRFGYEGSNGWTTPADVYAGSYFAYWPYERLGEIKEKAVSANEEIPQTADFTEEYLNKALRMSAQDFISVEDVNDEGLLEKNLYLYPMVNVIGVVATPNTGIDNEYLKGMEITKMTINAGGDNKTVFRDKGIIVPRRLPKAVVYNTLTGTYDPRPEEDLRKDMETIAAGATESNENGLLCGFTGTPAKSTLTTTIDANFKLDAENHILRAFAFPIQEGISYKDDEYPSIDVTVSSTTKGADWILGTFHVTDANESSAVMNLKDMLAVDKEGTTNSWIKNIMGDNTWRVAASEKNMSAMLNVNDFTPATTTATGNTIDSEAEWNDFVQLINALDKKNNFAKEGEGEKAYSYVEFELGDNVTLNNKIQVPNDVKIKLTTGSYTLKLAGDVEWPENLVVDNSDNIEVTTGSTLKVGSEGTALAGTGKEVVLDAKIINNGTIYAGKLASISTQDSKVLNNINGTVFVEFGAYVYPTENYVGVIAFEVKNSDLETIGQINRLIQTEDDKVFDKQNEWAYVNTLYIEGTDENNVTTLDLNALAEEEVGGNRYETTGTAAKYLLPLDNIDIVLKNGAVVYDPETAAQRNDKEDCKNVKNVYSEEGVNTIRDIEPLGNIEVTGGELHVLTDTEVYPGGKDLFMSAAGEISVKGGTLYGGTDIYVSKVTLYKPGQILTEKGASCDIYIPGENGLDKEDGALLGPGIKYTNGAEAQNVVKCLNQLKEDGNAASESVFLYNMNSYVVDQKNYDPANTNFNAYAGFYNYFSKWLVSMNRSALDGTQHITSDDLDFFEKVTGNILFE